MDWRLRFPSSVSSLVPELVGTCLISTDEKWRLWRGSSWMVSSFYARRLFRGIGRLSSSASWYKDQIKLRTWHLLFTVSARKTSMEWLSFRLWDCWSKRSCLHGNDPQLHFCDWIHDHVLVLDALPRLARAYFIHHSADIPFSSDMVVVAGIPSISLPIRKIWRSRESDEALL